MKNMLASGDIRAVLSFYGQGLEGVRRVDAVAGGWSGSRICKITTRDGGEYCLRRWPKEHPSAERLRFIHGVLGRVVASLDLIANPLKTPSRATFVEHGGHLWELTTWRPGKADFREMPSRERLRAAMRVLARFHEAAGRGEQGTEDKGQRAELWGVAPAVLDRERQVEGLVSGGLDRIAAAVERGLNAELDGRAGRILCLTRGRLADLRRLIKVAAKRQMVLGPAIRDIHHEHVLFTGDEVTGLIDFGAMRIDTPLTDVARLTGSLVDDDQEARRFAMDSYAELRPLTDSDRELIELLDQSGVALGGLNWLQWLYVERREMGPHKPIVRRLDEILGRLVDRA
jgi:homoserine kinase type II